MAATWLLILSSLLVASNAAKDLGPLLQGQCPEWGQISAECYKNQLNDIIAGVAQGVPALGLPSLEPFVAGPLNITIGVVENQSFAMSLNRMTFSGLSKTRVSSLKVGQYNDETPDEFGPLELTLSLPKLRVKTPYTSEGRFILLRAIGGGHLSFSFLDVSMRLRIKYSVADKNGERFAQVHSTRVQVGAGRSNIQVDSIDTNNELGRSMLNSILSASSDQIFELLFPFINEEFSKLFLDVARKTSANLPLSKVFQPWQEPPSAQ